MAPKGPLYSIGQISLLYLAHTTEKHPNVIPQMKRPTQMTQILLIMQIPIPMNRNMFITSIKRRLPYFMKGSQPIAPAMAPAIQTPVIIESYFVCSFESQSYMQAKEPEMLPHEPMPIPNCMKPRAITIMLISTEQTLMPSLFNPSRLYGVS